MIALALHGLVYYVAWGAEHRCAHACARVRCAAGPSPAPGCEGSIDEGSRPPACCTTEHMRPRCLQTHGTRDQGMHALHAGIRCCSGWSQGVEAGPDASLCSFWEQLKWWQANEISNFAGMVAFVFGLLMWGTSLSWVRRNFFEVRSRPGSRVQGSGFRI